MTLDERLAQINRLYSLGQIDKDERALLLQNAAATLGRPVEPAGQSTVSTSAEANSKAITPIDGLPVGRATPRSGESMSRRSKVWALVLGVIAALLGALTIGELLTGSADWTGSLTLTSLVGAGAVVAVGVGRGRNKGWWIAASTGGALALTILGGIINAQLYGTTAAPTKASSSPTVTGPAHSTEELGSPGQATWGRLRVTVTKATVDRVGTSTTWSANFIITNTHGSEDYEYDFWKSFSVWGTDGRGRKLTVVEGKASGKLKHGSSTTIRALIKYDDEQQRPAEIQFRALGSETKGSLPVVGSLADIGASTPTPTLSPPTATPTPNPRFAGCQLFESALRASLKAPSTAKFQSCANRTLTETEAGWKMSGYVDAQNGFGAMIRTYFVMTFIREGTQWQVTGITPLN